MMKNFLTYSDLRRDEELKEKLAGKVFFGVAVTTAYNRPTLTVNFKPKPVFYRIEGEKYKRLVMYAMDKKDEKEIGKNTHHHIRLYDREEDAIEYYNQEIEKSATHFDSIIKETIEKKEKLMKNLIK